MFWRVKMNNKPKLVVMLTFNDRTIPNAAEVFEDCKNSKAEIYGFKEEGIPHDDVVKLFGRIRECGKQTALEVVAYDEEHCLAGAELAVECGVDYLMGTMYFESVAEVCKNSGIEYMPYVGEITGRPSVLGGSADGMITEARTLLEKGADGFDLLGYRYTGDAPDLIRRFVSETGAKTVVAGSVDSFEKLDTVKKVSPWAFTIGSAFVENRFGRGFAAQIDTVCDYINK